MRKLFIFIILLVCTTILTSCWSARELNELGIAGAIGIDKAEDGYKVSVQLLNPGEIADQNKSTRLSVSTYSTTGATIYEALRKLTLDSPRTIYLAHVRVIVFGEELAKEGIKKVLDFISRNHAMRTDFYIIVAKEETAENVLSILTPIESIPANKLFSSLETSQNEWAPTKGVTLDELIAKITSEGSNPVLTGVRIIGSKDVGNTLSNVERVKSPALLQYIGLSGFKDDKLVDWLDETESKGFNYIQNNVNKTVGSIDCPEGGKLTVEVVRSNTNVKGLVENGEPKIEIETKMEANIGEVQCEIDLSKPESIEKIQKITEDRVKEVMSIAIKKAKEDLQSDIFGFGEAIHRANPELWKKWKKNWNEKFLDLSVDMKANVKIRRLGTITESFQKEEKKE